MGMKHKFREWWLPLSIRYKIGVFVGTIVSMVVVLCVFFMGAISLHMRDFNAILGDSYQVNQSLANFENENAAFMTYSQNRTDENFVLYQNAKQQAHGAITQLSLDYKQTGLPRHLIIQAIHTSYDYYTNECNRLLASEVRDTAYANQYYDTLNIATYISRYLQELMKQTLDEGNANFAQKMRILRLLPIMGVFLTIIIFILALLLAAMIMRYIIRPVLNLADSAQNIAANQFDTPDVYVQNQDEIGQLVKMFNKMKNSMKKYIATLQEVNQMESRLHQEALQKVEMEQQMKSMQLSILQSQINPHFLFNTLNTIRSTSKIEKAYHTEELIQRLSNLFRYNLQTSDAVVPLERELKVIQDYIYIQQRRFGTRLNFVLDNQLEGRSVFIPVFTLQPLVENAIIHGISSKVEGGSIRVRIRQRQQSVRITITDTGQGISAANLQQLLDQTAQQKGDLSHIGMGNVRSRLKMLFDNSEFMIYSRVGMGTSIRLILPLQKGEDSLCTAL